jgi:hypothetical protein
MSVLWTSDDGKYFISSDNSLLGASDPSEIAEGVPWMKDTDSVRNQVFQVSREVFGVYSAEKDVIGMFFYHLVR